jgi:hypothetical protein
MKIHIWLKSDKKILGTLRKDLSKLLIFGDIYNVRMSKTNFCVSTALPSGFVMFLTVAYSRKECTVGHATVLHYAYISSLVFKVMWCM